MPIESLALLGAGGHAAVVGEAALLAGTPKLTFYSQDAASIGGRILNYSIDLLVPDMQFVCFHVAIGDNTTRARLYDQFAAGDSQAVTIAHPQAIISPYAEVAEGCFVAAGAVIAPRSRIGRGVIVNHRAVVDHDVQVGNFSHIAPGVTLGGGSYIGERVLVGAGANILPGVAIGDAAVIGAGAVVIHDIPAGQTVVGVPAQHIKRGV